MTLREITNGSSPLRPALSERKRNRKNVRRIVDALELVVRIFSLGHESPVLAPFIKEINDDERKDYVRGSVAGLVWRSFF